MYINYEQQMTRCLLIENKDERKKETHKVFMRALNDGVDDDRLIKLLAIRRKVRNAE